MSWADVGKGIGGFFSGAAAWITPVNKGLDIVDQWVEDKDKAKELKAQIYIEELRCKTIPIVDALHKMGRQITVYLQLYFYFYCSQNGIEITQELVTGVSGGAAIYAMMKGRGK